MSLSTSDREDISGGMIIIYFCLLIAITIGTVLSNLSHQEVLDRLDDLCQAHYPECVVEQHPGGGR